LDDLELVRLSLLLLSLASVNCCGWKYAVDSDFAEWGRFHRDNVVEMAKRTGVVVSRYEMGAWVCERIKDGKVH